MSKGLEALKIIENELKFYYQDDWNITRYGKDIAVIEKDLKAYKELQKDYFVLSIKEKALDILIKWYQPDIIHDLCCFGASDEEIALVKEILNEH